MRAVLVLTGALALGGCIPTGDGCPFGGCRGEAPSVYASRTVAPVVNPFEQGGRFRSGRTEAEFDGDRMTFANPDCRFEAVRDWSDLSGAPAGWRMPPEAISAVYRITRSDGACTVWTGETARVAASARGHTWAPGRTFDQISIGPVAEGSLVLTLDRRS